MARPKKEQEEKRDCVLPPLRCTAVERNIIKQRAIAAGLTQSTYLRNMAVSGRVVVKQSKADFELVKQLRHIGVNLNQMTRAMHQTSGEIPAMLSATLARLQTLLDRVMSE